MTFVSEKRQMKTPGGIVEKLDGKLIVYAIRRVQTKDALPRLCKIWQQGHMSAGDARNEPEKNLFGKSTWRRQKFNASCSTNFWQAKVTRTG